MTQTVRSALIGIQVVPILLALRLTSRFPGYLGAYAAVSISAFWMLVMAFVWLSALGVSDLLPGPYAPIEIMLSMLTAVCAWAGVSRGLRVGRPLERRHKVATLAVFGVLQIVAVSLSLLAPASLGLM